MHEYYSAQEDQGVRALGQTANVYVYDHGLESIYLINSDQNGQDVFAVDLLQNYVLITDTTVGSVFCFDLIEREKIKVSITDSFYTLPTVTADNKFIARFIDNKWAKCLIVEFMP